MTSSPAAAQTPSTVTVSTVVQNDDGRSFTFGATGASSFQASTASPTTVTAVPNNGDLLVYAWRYPSDDVTFVSAVCRDAAGNVLGTSGRTFPQVSLSNVTPGAVINCTFTKSITPSIPRTVEIVTLAGRSDGWVKLGTTRNWVSAVCRSRLIAAGADLTEVSWPRLATLVDAAPLQRCDELIADLFVDEVRIVTLTGRTDGWVQVGDTRNWVSSACRAQMVSAGAVVREVSWATLSVLVDATPFQGCDDLLLGLFDEGVRIVTLAGRTDGWVQVGGTRNWVNATCRSQLVAAGAVVRDVPWSVLDSLVDATPLQRCDTLLTSLFV